MLYVVYKINVLEHKGHDRMSKTGYAQLACMLKAISGDLEWNLYQVVMDLIKTMVSEIALWNCQDDKQKSAISEHTLQVECMSKTHFSGANELIHLMVLG